MDITITRALSELKLLDKRIKKEISEAKFIAAVQKNKKVHGSFTKEEFAKNADASMTSILAMIQRRKELKNKIVSSNAQTIVYISSVQMTVAETIERKNAIAYEKELLFAMKAQYQASFQELEKKNADVRDKLDMLLINNFGKDIKASQHDVDAISKPYLDQNEWEFADPLRMLQKIENLEKEIDAFESEVDFVLSESNAITKITITD